MNHYISIQHAMITPLPPPRDDDDVEPGVGSGEPADVQLAEGTGELAVEDIQEAWWSDDDDDDEDTLRYVDIGGSE